MVFVKSLPPSTTDIIEEFLLSYFKESGATGVVMGLSGGLDSALCARICADAMSPARVRTVFMPSNNTSEQDHHHVEKIAEHIGVDLLTVPIGPIIDSYAGQLSVEGAGKPSSTVIDSGGDINLQPRIRMSILFYIANRDRLLVIGTSNKSELLTGYFTKYGDGASDLAIIGDLYKTQVFELSSMLGLPRWLLDKPPSPGLAPGVVDEDELGIGYGTLDQILAGFDQGYDVEYVAEKVGVDVEEARRIWRMIRSTIHKRRFPRIPKMGLNTVGLDRKET